MSHGKRKDEWERTSWLLSKMHNAWFAKKMTPEQLNPFTAAAARPSRKPDVVGRISDPRQLGEASVCVVR